MVPNSAWAMPTPHRMKYFHAASRRGRGAVQRNQQHGGERGRFHRHPQDAHVVGGQRQQHGEAEQLVHAVIEAQHVAAELAVVLLDAHVGAREQRGGEADEGGQRDQEHVERIDEELFVEGRHRAVADDLQGQHGGGDQGAEAHQRIEFGRIAFAAEQRQQKAAGERDAE